MLPETEFLQYVHKTADMGCQGIEAVLSHLKSDEIKGTLLHQQSEYQHIRSEAAKLLRQDDDAPENVGAVERLSAQAMSAMKLAMDGSQENVAEMTIQGTTMGVVKTIRHLKDLPKGESSVRALGEKLLATQENNVEQMKKFL